MPRALVVDDSRAIRTILGQYLEELGYQVANAENGKIAVEVLNQCSDNALPAVALVDWNMPEMNGIEFVKYVRSNHRYENMRLMMVTTETQPDQMLTALEAGANEYLMKPFTEAMVEEKLRMIGALE